jgi:surface antigen
LCLFGSLFLLSLPIASHAQQTSPATNAHKPASRHASAAHTTQHGHYGRRTEPVSYHRGKKSHIQRASYHVLQCVPFARAASGITLQGDALTWWDKAAGIYARGSRPEPGSVLAFRANRAMRLGHVAVVTRVINSREVEIEHAHWGQNGVSRNIAVIDVSPNNDWTAVRVALDRRGSFGSIYPTHGFIYDRPAGTEMADAGKAHAMPLNAAPHDLRSLSEQRAVPVLTSLPLGDELAEAPADGDIGADAPQRSLR